jgi:hypothetical protein
MDRIRAIQEHVDSHKEEIPTGVVAGVMAECQKAYEAQPKLYKLTWTTVDSHAHIDRCEDEEDVALVRLSPQIQTLIVDAVDYLPDHPLRAPPAKMHPVKMPHNGMVLKSWLELPMPHYIMHGEDSMVVLHSIVPYEPHKRAREGA